MISVQKAKKWIDLDVPANCRTPAGKIHQATKYIHSQLGIPRMQHCARQSGE